MSRIRRSMEQCWNHVVISLHRRNLDRQKVVTTTECPLLMKTRQSQYWLLHPTNESVRNRALSLSQCFSISRFSDVSKWQMSDLTTFTYSHELPCTGPYSVEVLYILQSEHKSIKVKASFATNVHGSCKGWKSS